MMFSMAEIKMKRDAFLVAGKANKALSASSIQYYFRVTFIMSVIYTVLLAACLLAPEATTQHVLCSPLFSSHKLTCLFF